MMPNEIRDSPDLCQCWSLFEYLLSCDVKDANCIQVDRETPTVSTARRFAAPPTRAIRVGQRRALELLDQCGEDHDV